MKGLWLLCLVFSLAHADTLSGYVVGVADGDTITLVDANHQQHKIRLAGIDAPEKAQPFGDRSKQNLAALVFNKNVIVEWERLDRYGRTVGKVLINGKDANLEQVNAGMAWWYEKYRKEQSQTDQDCYEGAEQRARIQRTGLWRDANPMPPWDWRHSDGAAAVEQYCPCDGGKSCMGPKGGHYCITSNGSRRYR